MKYIMKLIIKEIQHKIMIFILLNNNNKDNNENSHNNNKHLDNDKKRSFKRP